MPPLRHVQGYRIKGEELAVVPGSHLGECCAACEANNKCTAWRYMWGQCALLSVPVIPGGWINDMIGGVAMAEAVEKTPELRVRLACHLSGAPGRVCASSAASHYFPLQIHPLHSGLHVPGSRDALASLSFPPAPHRLRHSFLVHMGTRTALGPETPLSRRKISVHHSKIVA